MRILVIDEEFPFPLDSGKRIRSFNLLSRLAANAEIHYLAYGSETSESYAALEAVGIHPLAVPAKIPPQSGPIFYLRLLANLFDRHPYIVSRHHSRVFAEHLREAVARLKPDLLMCEWTPYAVFITEYTDIPRVVVAQNLEYRIWKRYYDFETSPLKKWYIGRQMTKVEAFERNTFNRVEGAVAVSSAEADEMRTFCSALPIAVVENGVDLDFFTTTESPIVSNSLVFVGAMHWRPNQDAVEYFADEIMPRLRRKRPELKVDLVGQAPPAHIAKLSSRPGLNITGRVEDVRPYVESAAVYIVPLRIGGGTRLKILEALAMKKAVVSTPVGAEGLEVTHGKDIMIADSADAFAQQVEDLLNDPDRARQLGENGRRLVEERYGWDRLAKNLEAFLSGLAAKQ